MSTTNPSSDVLRSDYQKSVAAYWNNNPNDDRVNLLLGDIDGLYHHHYGIGDYDPSVLEGPRGDPRRPDHPGAAPAGDRAGRPPARPPRRHHARRPLLDAGSGRGATSFMAHYRFGCQVDGVTISEYQVGFANDQAAERGVTDQVKFHFRNMLDTGFETGSRRGIWTNETTMYVDLFELFAEFSRLLEVGGRYVCITGC